MENRYFFADSNGRPVELIGTLRWAGPYCFQCDISLVTGQPGGYNVALNPMKFIVFQHDSCPVCGRDTNNNNGLQDAWGPTDAELVERKRYQGPVWYAAAFIYNFPKSKVYNLQKETQVVDSLGNLMTADFFQRNVLKEVKFHFYTPKK